MIETLFVLILVIAIVFFLLMVVWDSMIIGTISMILWFILAVGIYNYQIPYQAVLSDDTLSSGVQTINSMGIYSGLFLLMGFVTLIYIIVEFVYPLLTIRFKKMM